MSDLVDGQLLGLPQLPRLVKRFVLEEETWQAAAGSRSYGERSD